MNGLLQIENAGCHEFYVDYGSPVTHDGKGWVLDATFGRSLAHRGNFRIYEPFYTRIHLVKLWIQMASAGRTAGHGYSEGDVTSQRAYQYEVHASVQDTFQQAKPTANILIQGSKAEAKFNGFNGPATQWCTAASCHHLKAPSVHASYCGSQNNT
ncbi:hypothetical protein B0O80DRAFT_428050 [Mortierella sp. GBAus27b]|nr:hypothetical protein B0O80DRAFT_428050 [Mortierella sp. GBAus27b]